MKLEKMMEFIKLNNKEQLTSFYSELKENIQTQDKAINKLHFWMIITGVFYYLYRTSAISGLEFSVIKLADLKLIGLLTAPLFAVMMLYNSIMISRLSELMHFSRLISYKIYDQGTVTVQELAEGKFINHSRLIQPFSLPLELAKDVEPLKITLPEILFRLPSIVIGLIPLSFATYTTIKLFNVYGSSTIGLVVICFTLYIHSYTVYLFLKNMIIKTKQASTKENSPGTYHDYFNPFQPLR